VALDTTDAADLNLSALLPNEPSFGQRCNDSMAEEANEFNEGRLREVIDGEREPALEQAAFARSSLTTFRIGG